MSAARPDILPAISEIARLSAPGVTGFYTHFEAVEVFAILHPKADPFNIFTIIVAEERPPGTENQSDYIGGRIKLKSFDGWMFGIRRSLRPLADLTNSLNDYATTGKWCLSDKLGVGPLTPVPAQFVPPDSTTSAAWNHVLKNNFWNGSYLVELADPAKSQLSAFFEDPPKLQALSSAVSERIPIGLAVLSDRLGNIVVQFPMTAMIARLSRNRITGEASFEIGWHPQATPRPLRAACEIHHDNIISGYAEAAIVSPTTVLPVQNGVGIQRSVIWDDNHGVILSATGNTNFIKRIGMNVMVGDPEPRVFVHKGADGKPVKVRISLSSGTQTVVGPVADQRLEEWTRKRIYRDEALRLAQSRRFVQYRPKNGKDEHEKALNDVRVLLNQYGGKGAWLWDPYLTAEDILKTLFYSRSSNASLRALTAGLAIPVVTTKKRARPSLRQRAVQSLYRCFAASRPQPSIPSFTERQQKDFKAAQSNFRGLRLEFRTKTGWAGWPFHDRFLIFPDTNEGPLAWSLGTSVNSLGKQHHILQRVDNGQLVADAFNELWEVLDQPEHLVWKTP